MGDKFFSQMISGTVSWLLGLDSIFKLSHDYFSGETWELEGVGQLEFRWWTLLSSVQYILFIFFFKHTVEQLLQTIGQWEFEKVD